MSTAAKETHPDAARAPKTSCRWSSLGGGLFLPAYQKTSGPRTWSETDPNFAVIEEIIFNPVDYDGVSYPAEPSAAIDAVLAAAIPSQMMSNVTTGRMSAEEAVRGRATGRLSTSSKRAASRSRRA